MIEIHVKCTVTETDEHTDSGTDGPADYHNSVVVSRDVNVEARKEFPDGYVNLEGYAYETYSVGKRRIISDFGLDDHPAFCGDRRRLSVEGAQVAISGESGDWLHQSLLYMTERPSLSLVETVQNFSRWHETVGRSLRTALEGVRDPDEYPDTLGEAAGLVDVAVVDMTHGDWNQLVRAVEAYCDEFPGGGDFDRLYRDE